MFQSCVFFSCRCTFCFAGMPIFGSCTNFCMIPTYDYAVVPFFCSFTFYIAVVNLFLQLYNLLSDPILIDVRTTLKHKRTASLVTTPPPPVRRHHQIAAPGIVGTRNRPQKNHNQRSCNNMCARKESIHFCERLFFVIDTFFVLQFFVHQKHCWGGQYYMEKNMGCQFAAWRRILKLLV